VPDGTAPPPPPVDPRIDPRIAVFPPPRERSTSRGCLKWGLVGCAGISVILIVGLVMLGTKAKGFLDSKLREKGNEILVKASPDVTAEEKAAFEKAYGAFVERAKGGQVPISRMTSFTSKSDRALEDGKVTPDEIRDLTEEVGGPTSAPPRTPAPG